MNLARWNYPADDGGGEVPGQKATFGSDDLTADPSWKSQLDSDYLRMKDDLEVRMVYMFFLGAQYDRIPDLESDCCIF